jgi:hypothetical protein
MKHAGREALEQIEPVLKEIRKLDGVKEKTPGAFYRGSIAFLHFHEDPAGMFADLKIDGDFQRFPINTTTQTQALLRRAASAFNALKSGRSR